MINTRKLDIPKNLPKAIVENYDVISKLEKLGGKMSLERQLMICESIENIKNYRKNQLAAVGKVEDRRTALTEATNTGDVLSNKMDFLDLTVISAYNLIAPELYTVHPMKFQNLTINVKEMVTSSEKGQVKAGHLLNSAVNGGTIDPTYPTNYVNGEPIAKVGDTAAGTSTVLLKLKWSPVKLDTFQLKTADNSVFGTTNPNGVISGVGITAGQVNVDGTYYVTFAAAVTSPVTACYTYDNTYVSDTFGDGAKIVHINPQMRSVQLLAKPVTMSTTWSVLAENNYNIEYSGGFSASAKADCANELTREIDNALVAEIVNNPELVHNVEIFDATVGDRLTVDGSYMRFIKLATTCSTHIYNQTGGKYRANYMVCGTDLVPILSALEGKGFETTAYTNIPQGPYQLGVLNKTIKVFVTNNMLSNLFVFGYKATREMDAAAVFAPFILPTATDLLRMPNLQVSQAFYASYDSKIINPRVFIGGSVVNCEKTIPVGGQNPA